MRKPRIAIATSGRFHVLDLARELDALGHEVRFHSYLTASRAARFGLPAHCHAGYLPFVAPLLAWEQFAPGLASDWRVKILYAAFNRAVIARLRPCDAFIGMSGAFVEAPLEAKRRYGAKIIMERGSRHILSQREILMATPGARPPNDYEVERELRGYECADYISVPSRQVAASFDRDPALAAKLMINPYGVDLDQFPRSPEPRPDGKVTLFVGNWIFRKGVDILTKAVERIPGARLIHVGALGDAPFPDDPRFVHHDPVPQWRLKEFYAKAHVFAMASREEGLALVQAQALASGLPLVCTDRTGGADLAHTPALAARIAVAPSDDVEAFTRALSDMLDKVAERPDFRRLPEADRQTLSWRAYGERYAENLALRFGAQQGRLALDEHI